MGSICGFAILGGVCGNLCCLTLRWSVRFLSSVKPLIHVVQVCMQAGCSASFFPALPSGKEQPSQIWHAAICLGTKTERYLLRNQQKHRTVMKEVHSDRKNGAGWYELSPPFFYERRHRLPSHYTVWSMSIEIQFLIYHKQNFCRWLLSSEKWSLNPLKIKAHSVAQEIQGKQQCA